MSGFRPPESHVAQQIRRDKLRVQNTSQEIPNNLEQLSLHVPGFNNLDLLQVRNVRNANNMLDEVPPAYSTSPSEVVTNFPTALNPPLEYQEQLGRLMMHHHRQYGSFHNSNSPKEQSEARYLGNWRSSGGNSNQGCDNWFVNYGSGSVVNDDGNNNHNTSLLAAAEISNVSYNELTGVVATSRETMQQHPPLSSSPSPLYQNALQDIVKSASSMSAQGSDNMVSSMHQTGQGMWVGDASELELHPSYGNQLPNQSRCGGPNLWTNQTVDNATIPWSSQLGFTEKKVDEQSGTLLSDSNPQSLSLSLSSNAQCKTSVSHFEEGSASYVLQSKDPQYMKYVRSFMKPSVVSRDCGKSPQDSSVGVPPITASYRNVGPLGPFTGYATILKSSRFLKSAQQLLDEFCCLSSPKFSKTCDVPERVSGGGSASTSADAVTAINEAEAAAKGGSNSGSSSSVFYGANENNSGTDWGAGCGSCLSPRPDFQQKKARLLYMLEEVTRRYKQYHQQMQMVVSSFDSVAGLSSATPYISLALKSVSRHFRSLKSSISDQLKHISEVLGEDYSSLPTATASTCSNVDTNMGRPRCMNQSFQKNKPGRGSTGLVEPQQHVWRPQRGLPERAVAILKAWLFEHFLHPYPTDTDKHMLATQTGLSRNQVSNWFINARVRVWKPMVEEIHTLETKGTTTGANQNISDQNERACGTEDGGTSQHQHNRVDKPVSKFGMMHSIPESQSPHHHDQCMEMPSSEGNGLDAEGWSQEKRSRLECQMSSSGLDGSLMGFVPYRRGGLEVGGGGLGSVSLTLGLRHGVEGVQSQQQQQLQEEQLRRHLIWRAYDP